MKTAVQWLKEQYIDRGETIPSGVFQEALEKEKEQIMDSYLQGSFDDGPNITNSEQYYNQTFN